MLAGAGGCVGDCWRLLVPAGDWWRVVAGVGGWWSHLLGADFLSNFTLSLKVEENGF